METVSMAAVADQSPAARPGLLRPRRRTPRTLGELMATFGGQRVGARLAQPDHDDTVTGVSVASLDVAPGDLFVALPGPGRHGAEFSCDAAERGAAAVLTDPAGAPLVRAELPTIVMADPRAQLADLAAWMYPTASWPQALLGVTGTNGKTSTVYIIDAILQALGVPAGVSTTVERRSGTSSVPGRLTTPEAPELYALLARMREDGARAACLEVSAHGVSRGRVDGVMFDVAGFTNLSHDHLDEYRDMDEYFAAKARLFTPRHARRGIVSLDSRYGQALAARATTPVETISSRPEVAAQWSVRVLDEQPSSTAFSVEAPDGASLMTEVSLLGRHMAADAGLAIAMLVAAGFDLETIERALDGRGIPVSVPGRSVRVSGQEGPLVMMDFSHNGAAIRATLQAMRRITRGALILVVGADGDRDPSKREDMGRLGAATADVVIITDHHPRHEDPAAIRSALIRGARHAHDGAAVYDLPQPAVAIRKAISMSGPDDAILWAGPGVTDYRVVGGDRVPYSPRRDAREALREAGWF